MSNTPFIALPESYINAITRIGGEVAHQWLTDLPIVIQQLCNEWSLVLDGPPMFGHLGLAIPALRDMEPCILKLSCLDESQPTAAIALSAWNGNGAVRLLAYKPSVQAMLLEKLDHQKTLRSLPLDQAIPVTGQLMRQLAVPAPEGLISQTAWVSQFTEHLLERWNQFGKPFPAALLETARSQALELRQPTTEVIVNFDLWDGNILAASRAPWLTIDPMVIAGDLEFGIAQILWRRIDEINGRATLNQTLEMLVTTADLNAELARAWTVVRCVDYWLWGLSIGLTEDPIRCETITDWLA